MGRLYSKSGVSRAHNLVRRLREHENLGRLFNEGKAEAVVWADGGGVVVTIQAGDTELAFAAEDGGMIKLESTTEDHVVAIDEFPDVETAMFYIETVYGA